MSVPPEIEASWTSRFTFAYTQSKPSGASGEPVESTVRSGERSCVVAGSTPALAAASMNLAEVPKTATRSRSARSKSTPRVRMERASRRRAPASRPDASPDTSQFHIIQPVVVK